MEIQCLLAGSLTQFLGQPGDRATDEEILVGRVSGEEHEAVGKL